MFGTYVYYQREPRHTIKCNNIQLEPKTTLNPTLCQDINKLLSIFIVYKFHGHIKKVDFRGF